MMALALPTMVTADPPAKGATAWTCLTKRASPSGVRASGLGTTWILARPSGSTQSRLISAGMSASVAGPACERRPQPVELLRQELGQRRVGREQHGVGRAGQALEIADHWQDRAVGRQLAADRRERIGRLAYGVAQRGCVRPGRRGGGVQRGLQHAGRVLQQRKLLALVIRHEAAEPDRAVHQRQFLDLVGERCGGLRRGGEEIDRVGIGHRVVDQVVERADGLGVRVLGVQRDRCRTRAAAAAERPSTPRTAKLATTVR